MRHMSYLFEGTAEAGIGVNSHRQRCYSGRCCPPGKGGVRPLVKFALLIHDLLVPLSERNMLSRVRDSGSMLNSSRTLRS